MMTPLTFSGRFGWLHPAAGPCGVVLCGSHGLEQLGAHAGWRMLADMIAAQGSPVLRFDYLGTGDSLDGDADGRCIAGWLESVSLAIDELRRLTGVSRVVLIGLRIGGALAAMAARERRDIAGLALLAPVISGRAWRRELSARAQLAGHASAVPDTAAIELGGFLLTRDAQAELDAIMLSAVSAPQAIPCYFAATESQDAARAMAEAWRAHGLDVTIAPFAGFADYCAEPTFARPPLEDFARLLAWLKQIGAGIAFAAPDLARGVPFRKLVAPRFVETPVLFGPGGKLFGMLCEPRGPRTSADPVLFVNTGANPHIGWARMAVSQARMLASEGVVSFRIDVAGLGDSPAAAGRDGCRLYSHEPQTDIAAAMDWLQERGHPRAVLVGLCSGAYLAFHAAVRDARVSGLVMANLQYFDWPEGLTLEDAVARMGRSTAAYREKLRDLQAWARVLKGDVEVGAIARRLASRMGASLLSRLKPLKAADRPTVEQRFTALAKRGTRCLAVFSEGDPAWDEMERQMGARAKRFRALPGTDVRTIPASDHNLTSRASRETFETLLARFLGPARSDSVPGPFAAATRDPARQATGVAARRVWRRPAAPEPCSSTYFVAPCIGAPRKLHSLEPDDARTFAVLK